MKSQIFGQYLTFLLDQKSKTQKMFISENRKAAKPQIKKTWNGKKKKKYYFSVNQQVK